MNKTFAITIRRIAQIAMGCLALYIIFANFTPFGASAQYTSDNTKEITKLGPANRVESVQQDGTTVNKLIDNLAYFYSAMPFVFEHATVRVNFENPYPDQNLTLGYQDQPTWHYNSQVLDSPLIDGLNWNKLGDGPYLFQRNKIYNSVSDFMTNPPKEMVGVYHLEQEDLINDKMKIPGYQPKQGLTYLETDMRGKQTFYVYLENEQFHMDIMKQDLNWYDDPDIATVKIYKGTDLVMQSEIGDDGDETASKKVGGIQTISLDNPGPGLPEPGVYKIEISGSDDLIIRGIRTNLSKIVWKGPIYLTSNADVYGSVFNKTIPNTLYTSSIYVSAKTLHTQSLQQVKVGDKILNLSQTNQSVNTDTAPNSEVTVPKSDVVLNGSGYFVFSRDQYFAPTGINSIEISDQGDLSKVNFVLSTVPQTIANPDGSRTAILEFDLSGAYLNRGRLSWMISAPGLKEAQRSVLIKKIEINMSKKGWLK